MPYRALGRVYHFGWCSAYARSILFRSRRCYQNWAGLRGPFFHFVFFAWCAFFIQGLVTQQKVFLVQLSMPRSASLTVQQGLPRRVRVVPVTSLVLLDSLTQNDAFCFFRDRALVPTVNGHRFVVSLVRRAINAFSLWLAPDELLFPRDLFLADPLLCSGRRLGVACDRSADSQSYIGLHFAFLAHCAFAFSFRVLALFFSGFSLGGNPRYSFRSGVSGRYRGLFASLLKGSFLFVGDFS
jgi:hypothetical protein